jgi:hypothetical protein
MNPQSRFNDNGTWRWALSFLALFVLLRICLTCGGHMLAESVINDPRSEAHASPQPPR